MMRATPPPIVCLVAVLAGCPGAPAPEDETEKSMNEFHFEDYCSSLDAALTPDDLRALTPIAHWRADLAAGAHAGPNEFTEESIGKCETILVKFLDELAAAGRDRTRQRAAFERAVKAFDRLNEESRGDLIETGEREELGAFFNRAADIAGLAYEDGDVTWEWRENW
jgi:hypothetical protein